MIALVATALASKPTFTVDYSALAPAVGSWAVRTAAVDCSGPHGDAVVDGLPARPLGVAIEIYSRKGGLSSWGHASVRFLFCQDGRLRDAEYEAYAFDRKTGTLLRDYWPGDPVLDDSGYLRGERGRLVLYRNDDPVDGGNFASSALYNREIYELWLDLPPDEAARALTSLDAAWLDEKRRMDAREPLADRYRPLGDNCTWPLAHLLPDVDAQPLPMAWLRRLSASDRVEARVLYPSHWAVRRLARAGSPAEIARLHPVFRWSTRLPPDLPTTAPVAVARLRPGEVGD